MTNAAISVTIPTTAAFLGLSRKPLKVVTEEVSFKKESYFGVALLTQLQLRFAGDVYVLNDCVMTVNQERNIVETNLQGRDGSVKQYISDGDYTIAVQAAIDNDSALATKQKFKTLDGYPMSEMKFFMLLLRAKQAIEVTSDWLDLFGVRSVVIKNYNFEQETYSNRQTFTMQMLSDEPFEIKLLK